MADLLPLLATVLVLVIIDGSLAAVILWKSRRAFRSTAIIIMLSEILTGLGYLMCASTQDLGEKWAWVTIEYMGYLVGLPAFLVFSSQFSGRAILKRWHVAMIAAVSSSFIIAVATNGYHHLFYSSFALSPDIYRTYEAVYGPIFYVYTAYIMSAFVAGFVVLVIKLLRSSRAFRKSALTVCLSSFVVLALAVVTFAMRESNPGVILTLVSFVISSILLFIGAFGFELFGMVPFAIDRVMETMPDGIVLLDDQNCILYLNPAAEGILGKSIDACYQKPLLGELKTFPPSVLTNVPEPDQGKAMVHELVAGRRFGVQSSLIKDQSGFLTGKLITLRDLTEQKRAEEEALHANVKLDLLSSITRHDILNQLMVIEGNLALMQEKTDDKDLLHHIDIGLGAKRVIERQIAFAKDYQEMGNQAQAWQEVERAFRDAGDSLLRNGVRLSTDVGGIELLADPLLSKVFYNLIDNSLAHGERVSSISLGARRDGDILRLIYEDDGMGVLPEHKESIFEKGFGKRTGLGLFLSREILAISGMTIVEEGEPGRGARFVISVPARHYRLSQAT